MIKIKEIHITHQSSKDNYFQESCSHTRHHIKQYPRRSKQSHIDALLQTADHRPKDKGVITV